MHTLDHGCFLNKDNRIIESFRLVKMLKIRKSLTNHQYPNYGAVRIAHILALLLAIWEATVHLFSANSLFIKIIGSIVFVFSFLRNGKAFTDSKRLILLKIVSALTMSQWDKSKYIGHIFYPAKNTSPHIFMYSWMISISHDTYFSISWI